MNLISEIAKQLVQIQGTKFVSFVYLTKKSNELARYTLILGFNYHTAVEKSVTELEILMQESAGTWTKLQVEAASVVMASLKATLAAHTRGEQNPNYTKRGQYLPIENGLNINLNDGTLQLFGLEHTKVSLVQGDNRPVNSQPLTIEKNKIKSQLTVGKFREFALDLSQVAQCRINGQTLELDKISVTRRISN